MASIPPSQLRLPAAPRSIQKGTPLKFLLGAEAVECLAHNVRLVFPDFDATGFQAMALENLEPLGILDRGKHLARALRDCLPADYDSAVNILVDSLTPPLDQTSDMGLAVFFYLPHVSFVGQYGLSREGNGGRDPFEASMRAQYELTRRFSAEFCIRPFLIHEPARTLQRLLLWTDDPDPHVRRLCSEGTRPRLPWAVRIPAFQADPAPVLPILEKLRNDPSLYVRRSVANHLGDIAKDHPALVFEICERWLAEADDDLRWVIRHALRHPAKKMSQEALRLRGGAKGRGNRA